MNSQYALYIKSILNLIGTMIIKDVYTVNKINNDLVLAGYSVNNDYPNTWKYYLNISGQYHVSDQRMQVRARETGEFIDFTRENLLTYRDTRNAYSWGSIEYNDIIRRYPQHRTLINGIIWPVDINVAINANDHAILRYETRLIESNEEYLISDLQLYINDFWQRWYNPDYALYEDYYHLVTLANLSTKLVLEIIRLREKATRTDRVHSYHIRQYLSSFSEAGREFDFMPKSLQLWLYRNIKYINLNIGREETFDDVVQHVMTDLGFSLVGYNLEHRYDGLPDNLVPDIVMHGDTLNGIYPARGGLLKTVFEIVEKENPLARDNFSIADLSVELATEGMEINPSHSIKTKVLESNAIDNTDSEPFTLAEISLNHWIYLSELNLYSTRIQFKNPSDGAEYSLSVKDAFIFFLYAYNMSNGVELEEIPKVQAHRVLRIPPASFEELREMESNELVSDESIRWVQSLLPVPGLMISTVDFKEFCVRVREGLLAQRFHYLMMGDWHKEVAMQKLVDRLYMSVCIDLAPGMTYDEWLTEKEIETGDMSVSDFQVISDSIMVSAIGQDYGQSRSTRDIHEAMVRILNGLTSYSVQVIGDINQAPIRILNGKAPKVRMAGSESQVSINVDAVSPIIKDINGRPKLRLPIDPTVKPTLSFTQQWVICPIPVNAWMQFKSKRIAFTPIEVIGAAISVRPMAEVNLSDLDEVTAADYLGINMQAIYNLIDPLQPFEDYSKLTGPRLTRFKAEFFGT